MDEDVDLPPNATIEEIEAELVFQETLLQTLDTESFSYQDERDKIARKMDILQARYDAIAPPEDDLGGEAHQMLNDAELDFPAFFEEDDDCE
jgi:hypothetical protein